jgi:hypothetical protein
MYEVLGWFDTNCVLAVFHLDLGSKDGISRVVIGGKHNHSRCSRCYKVSDQWSELKYHSMDSILLVILSNCGQPRECVGIPWVKGKWSIGKLGGSVDVT